VLRLGECGKGEGGKWREWAAGGGGVASWLDARLGRVGPTLEYSCHDASMRHQWPAVVGHPVGISKPWNNCNTDLKHLQHCTSRTAATCRLCSSQTRPNDEMRQLTKF
jgi:hypothetical protein